MHRVLKVDFLLLPMLEFNVILYKDWLSMHGALFDFSGKKVVFSKLDRHVAEFQGLLNTYLNLISAL